MTTAPAPTRFDTDTAVDADGPDRWSTVLAEHWNVHQGPNGGYLAALIARAMTAEIADPGRALRSLTVHYLARPEFGPATIDVDVVRAGRSLSSVAATLRQDDHTVATALAAFSVPWESPIAWNRPMPDLSTIPAIDRSGWTPPPHVQNFDVDLHVDAPLWSGEGDSQAAAWIRTVDPRPLDAIALVAISDAVPPAVFPRITDRVAVPTIDLTVHIRSPLPHPGLADDDRVLARFRTEHAADGFVEEDGLIWAPDGTLLAQSRQLAIAR